MNHRPAGTSHFCSWSETSYRARRGQPPLVGAPRPGKQPPTDDPPRMVVTILTRTAHRQDRDDVLRSSTQARTALSSGGTRHAKQYSSFLMFHPRSPDCGNRGRPLSRCWMRNSYGCGEDRWSTGYRSNRPSTYEAASDLWHRRSRRCICPRILRTADLGDTVHGRAVSTR